MRFLTFAFICGIIGMSTGVAAQGVGGCLKAPEAVKMLERAKFYRAMQAVDKTGLVMILMYVNEKGDYIFFTSDIQDNMCQVGTGGGFEAFKIGRSI